MLINQSGGLVPNSHIIFRKFWDKTRIRDIVDFSILVAY